MHNELALQQARSFIRYRMKNTRPDPSNLFTTLLRSEASQALINLEQGDVKSACDYIDFERQLTAQMIKVIVEDFKGPFNPEGFLFLAQYRRESQELGLLIQDLEMIDAA